MKQLSLLVRLGISAVAGFAALVLAAFVVTLVDYVVLAADLFWLSARGALSRLAKESNETLPRSACSRSLAIHGRCCEVLSISDFAGSRPLSEPATSSFLMPETLPMPRVFPRLPCLPECPPMP